MPTNSAQHEGVGRNPRPRLQDRRMAGLHTKCKCLVKSLTDRQIRFLGDPQGEFTNKLDLAFDATAIFGQPRSKRYALLIEDGKVKEAHVEPDNTGVNGAVHNLIRRCA